MNKKELEKKLKKWQARLGLSDWEITAVFKDAIDLEQCQGISLIQKNTQNAYIRLMSLDDRQKCDRSDQDPELDLVHELIHIRLWSIDPIDANEVEHTCREQAIEWIAKALIKTDRKD